VVDAKNAKGSGSADISGQFCDALFGSSLHVNHDPTQTWALKLPVLGALPMQQLVHHRIHSGDSTARAKIDTTPLCLLGTQRKAPALRPGPRWLDHAQ
jgi:hypothetical protein